MKKGYKIENYNCENSNFILVSNFTALNEIINTGFYSDSSNIFKESDYNVGVWKINYKKNE